MSDTAPFAPDWVSPPGDTIADLLDERGLTRAEFAERTGYTQKHVNELLHGRAPITADTALRLEAVLGSTASFWLNREVQYRVALSRREQAHSLEKRSDRLDEIPVKDLVSFGWIRKCSSRAALAAEVLQFFGVASWDAFDSCYQRPLAAFRTSNAFDQKTGAVAAWLRRGELQASRIACAPWNPSALRASLPDLRRLTTERDPHTFFPRLVEHCARSGVAVTAVRAPRGCRASGATRFQSPERAMLLLSFRHLSDDQLWFSLFHELGHLLEHGKRAFFLEGIGLSSAEEEEANRFAANSLIPPEQLPALKAACHSRPSLVAFAERLGISAGIVVGRLQHDGLIPYGQHEDLKVRYRWDSLPLSHE